MSDGHSDPALDQILARLPQPSARNVTLRVSRSAARELRRGHPWLFDQAIEHRSHEGQPGDLAVLFDPKKRFVGLGLYDPRSPIRVKLLHAGKPTPIDADFFASRIEAAVALRAPLAASDTDGYRVLFGESDGVPGLIVDRYASTLVVKLYAEAWGPWLGWVLRPLVRALSPERMVLRLSRALQGLETSPALEGLYEGQILLGSPLEGPILFRERGAIFEVDPVHGQKTGFFLDQRENRARVEGLARGREVLNVFAYTGGFSLFAARGLARSVLDIDLNPMALEASRRNFAHNQAHPGVAACVHQTLAADAFVALGELAGAGRRFDLVVVDPPSFARRQSHIERALEAYGRLVRLALAVLRPDGVVVIASCSSRIRPEVFLDHVIETARRAGRPLTLDAVTGHALDHPVPESFPEAAYLKCIFARA